ncbi:uncharacterized protein LOC125026886 [Penaeus chinensis]|uniref:uncharacterized protein LOC125026886 n=1 Tax=Penaeus chinensis TaxID=139456 RepID=UPI001FB69CE6|nr:uncharacterized protein LOC125026886 [Penaeus chinensis]
MKATTANQTQQICEYVGKSNETVGLCSLHFSKTKQIFILSILAAETECHTFKTMGLQARHLGVTLLWCLFSVSLFNSFSSDVKPRYFGIPNKSLAKTKQADACRSLFTINQVFTSGGLRHAKFVHSTLTNESGFNIHPATTYREEEVAAAAREVRHLVSKRASFAGPDTDDYRVLGSLLPKLVAFEHLEGEDEAPAGTKQAQPRPHVRGGSRIDAGGGVLPFVPCVIAPYDQSNSFATCVRRRLARKGSFWIYFMGDSKIRGVFMEMLKRTDGEFDYRIEVKPKYPNQTWSYAKIVSRQDFRHQDMRVTSAAADGLVITMSFRVFVQMERPSRLPDEAEVTQLRRWADGADPLPDILILGYTSWMLQRHMEDANILELLDGLFEMHKAVVPHIVKISRSTRVLVLPQSRPKPHAAMINVGYSIINVPNFDWSEKIFLQEVQKHSRNQGVPRSEKQQDDHRPGLHSGTFRDHLIPGTSTPGLWWWDSSLPINLAEIEECNELHRRDLAGDVAYTGPRLQCRDIHHAGEETATDLVTMLFNLMCNSVLKLHESLCCS